MPVNSKLKIFIQKSLKGLNEEEIKMICSLLRRAEREMVGIPQFWGERIDEFLIRGGPHEGTLLTSGQVEDDDMHITVSFRGSISLPGRFTTIHVYCNETENWTSEDPNHYRFDRVGIPPNRKQPGLLSQQETSWRKSDGSLQRPWRPGEEVSKSIMEGSKAYDAEVNSSAPTQAQEGGQIVPPSAPRAMREPGQGPSQGPSQVRAPPPPPNFRQHPLDAMAHYPGSGHGPSQGHSPWQHPFHTTVHAIGYPFQATAHAMGHPFSSPWTGSYQHEQGPPDQSYTSSAQLNPQAPSFQPEGQQPGQESSQQPGPGDGQEKEEGRGGRTGGKHNRKRVRHSKGK